MGQFESRTEAAQSQLEAEKSESGLLLKVPPLALDFATSVLDILVLLPDAHGMVGLNLALKTGFSCIKALAANRSERNVTYLVQCIADDVRNIGHKNSSLEIKIDAIRAAVTAERFQELAVEAASQATRTYSMKKIERLASVVAHGSITFSSKPVDAVLDYERHCVELSDTDVILLEFLHANQIPISSASESADSAWNDQIRRDWFELSKKTVGVYCGIPAINARSCFARLQSRGLISQISWGDWNTQRGTEPYAILDEGREFLRFLKSSDGSEGHSNQNVEQVIRAD